MAKKVGVSKAVAAESKAGARCELCFKPIIDGKHEGGICSYERLKQVLEKNGGITIMA